MKSLECYFAPGGSLHKDPQLTLISLNLVDVVVVASKRSLFPNCSQNGKIFSAGHRSAARLIRMKDFK